MSDHVDLASLPLEAVIPAEILPAPSYTGRAALLAILWKLADDVGRLRRAGAPAWMLDEVAARVEVALGIVAPSAAELVAAGVDVDDALEVALDRGERVRRLVGEDDGRP